VAGRRRPPTESRGDATEHAGEREPPGRLHLTDLIATELPQVAIDQQRGEHHDDEAERRDPWRDDEQQDEQQAEEEAQRGQPDAAGQMGVEVGPADLFDQARILPREALLDLLEDPLFVLAERHPISLTWPGERSLLPIIGVERSNGDLE